MSARSASLRCIGHHRTLRAGFAGGVAFVLALGLGVVIPRAVGAEPLIRELPQGSWIEMNEAVLIPSNTWDLPLGGIEGLRCKLRMRQAKPFSRVLPRGVRLRVEGVHQAGFTARRQISLFSFIEFSSESVEDLSCSGAVRSTLADLRRALGSRMTLRTAGQAGESPMEIH